MPKPALTTSLHNSHRLFLLMGPVLAIPHLIWVEQLHILPPLHSSKDRSLIFCRQTSARSPFNHQYTLAGRTFLPPLPNLFFKSTT